MAWSYQILPYLEEGSIHQIATSEQDLKQAVVSIYVCPSRRQAKTYFEPTLQQLFSTIDYAGAVPATRISAPPSANTARYNMANYQPFSTSALTTLTLRVFAGGNVI